MSRMENGNSAMHEYPDKRREKPGAWKRTWRWETTSAKTG